MHRILGAVTIAFVTLMSSPGFPQPASAGPGSQPCLVCPPVQASGAGNGIEVVGVSGATAGSRPVGEGVEGGGTSSHPVSATARTFEERRVGTACDGSSPDRPDIYCENALGTCPDPVAVRSFVWRRTVTITAGPPRSTSAGPWQKDPGSYCLSAPEDSSVPLAVRVIAQVQDLFARNRLPLPVARVIARPGPRTLVNLPTRLTAGTAATTELTTSVLGLAVHISARPTTWDWTLAGERLTTSSPTLQQTYLRPGTSPAGVTITWTGTFRIGDDPTQHPLVRPAIVRGVPLILQVLEAHAERVTG